MADRAPEDITELEGRAELEGRPEIESRPDLEGRIDRLQAAADDAAGQVRNLYIAFLSFGLYLAITVGATTDEQLLRESPVRLPIVDVGLPLVAFYWIAPLLFVLFHFNLLMQLYLLSEKLHRLDAAIRRLPDDAQRERRATFSQFVFSQMLVGAHASPLIRVLLNVIAWTAFVVLPVAVLLLVQIQFLPYHDALTTWWQRCLVVLDLLLLWLLWLRAIDPTGHLSRQFRVVVQRQTRRVLRGLAEPLDWPAWPVIGLLSLARLARTLPARMRGRLRGDPKRDWRLLRLQELSAISLLTTFLIVTIPGEFFGRPLDGLIGERGNMGVLNRNLSLREKQLVLERPPPALAEGIGEEKAFAKYTRGLDLQGRDLRYADLEFADLRKADFREGASLQGAILLGADLQGADLGQADLQGAILGGAELQGADLRRADLQGADVRRADLRGANLTGAGLRGTILEGANLKGADLRVAHLWRATIGDEPDRDALWDLADLRGADIEPVDVGALIAEVEANIAEELTRTEVVGRLELTLRDDERTEVPSWQGQPHVIFQESDPIPRALGWAAPTMTEADYDEKLATFLGNLACDEDGSPALAQGLALRAAIGAIPGQPNRLLYQRLAQRLTLHPAACPSAVDLPEALRAALEHLAAHLDQPPADQAEPRPAPLDPPSQEPQPSVPND